MTKPLATHEFSFPAMGSDCSFRLVGEEHVAIRAALEAEREVERIEAKYSRYRADSFLSAINGAAASGGTIDVDPETAFFIDAAFAAWNNSDGAFDVTSGVLRQAWGRFDRLPATEVISALLLRIGLDKVTWQKPHLRFSVAGMEIDLGGLAKEYAADRAADICRRNGIASGIVELGGDIAIVGPPEDADSWDIAIRHPRHPDRDAARFQLAAGGLATSGDYERAIVVDGRRYSHILDPRSGWPVEDGLASVTVAASSSMLAGLIATMAILRGAEGPAWLATRGHPYLAIDISGEIVGQSADFSRK